MGGKRISCPKSRTREAGARVVVKLSVMTRRVRRRVADGPRPETNFAVRSLIHRRELLASCLRRLAADMSRIAQTSGGGPSFNKLGSRRLQSRGPTFDQWWRRRRRRRRWLAGCCRSGCSQHNGWVSSQADFIVSRRLLAVLRGRPRTLVPVRQYLHRITTYCTTE